MTDSHVGRVVVEGAASARVIEPRIQRWISSPRTCTPCFAGTRRTSCTICDAAARPSVVCRKALLSPRRATSSAGLPASLRIRPRSSAATSTRFSPRAVRKAAKLADTGFCCDLRGGRFGVAASPWSGWAVFCGWAPPDPTGTTPAIFASSRATSAPSESGDA